MPSSKSQNKHFYKISCITCRREYDEQKNSTVCPICHDPLEAVYDYDFIRSRLNIYDLKHSPISALKYLELYPIRNFEKIISLEEGGTPLIKSKNISKKLGIPNLYIKNEGANPTGVFKDRGTLVEVTKALEVGAKSVCLASTGNMAASVAAYCSLANLPCYVLVPEGTAIGKLSQTLSYGARVIQIRGTYSDCACLAAEMAHRHNFYLAGDYVFRLEGQKSQAYEIVEQLYWKIPDYVVCPIGCGTNLSAIWKGFLDFKALGLITKLPKLIGVQPVGCNPIVAAYKKRTINFTPVAKPQTICTAVAAGNPLDGKQVLKAIMDSGGLAIDIEDNDALIAEQTLAKEEGIFIEPSGALTIAALQYLHGKKVFGKNDVVVCIATGNGLKDPITALKVLPDPPSIEPDIEEIDKYLKNKLYQISGTMAIGKSDKLWKKTPEHKKLKSIIKNEFNISLADVLIKRIHKICRSFEKKGRVMTKSDLQNVIEEALNEFSLKEKALKIKDFAVRDSIHKKAHACVDLEYEDRKYSQNCAEGDGIFDAIIAAVKSALGKAYLGIELTDYKVGITTEGTAAVTKVAITLIDKNKNVVVATSSSPDVIVASVYAFEKGYNILYWKNK